MESILQIIISILRFGRHWMSVAGEINIGGFPLAPFLHLAVAFFLMLILRKFFPIKKSIVIVACFILLKEFLDIFAKSRIEYIIPPDIDTPIDIVAGSLGILSAIFFGKWIRKKKKLL